jgi:site-specific DNA recombinase
MRAALYARYSTDLQRKESIADQLRTCERLADRHGFTVALRFNDEAISGGTTQRPGYQDMLKAARRREFDVIIAEDTSRLWRNLAEQAPRLAELSDLGIQVVTHDLDTRHESAEIMGAVGGAMASAYRKEIGRRTRRGLEGNARAGKSAGGRSYGYISAADAGTEQRVIDPDQAAIVRRIFEMYAEGSSAKTIAATLNRENVPSPGSSWARSSRRRKSWLCSAIAGDPVRGTGIINNDSYRGVVVWNRSRWIRSAADSANRRAVANPKSEWVEHKDESLRIISDELWQRVKTRQRQRAHSVGARIKAGLSKKSAATGREPKHVFSGWLTCSECGARFTMVNARAYGCASYANGRACSNGRLVRRDLVEDRILAGVRLTLGCDEVLDEIERRVRKALAADRKVKPDLKRIADLRDQLDNLVSAVATGGMRSSPAIGRKLAEVESELERLESVRAEPTVVPLVTGLRARIRAAVARLPRLLEQDPERARAALRDAGLGPMITLRPATDGAYLNAEIDLEILPLMAVSNGLSGPTGHIGNTSSEHIGNTFWHLRETQNALEGVLQDGRADAICRSVEGWREDGGVVPRVRYLAQDRLQAL